MSIEQPEGAVISLPSGAISGMAFSPDGKSVYVARAGSITAYNISTGLASGTWTIGAELGGIDISADGRYLVATDRISGLVGAGSGSQMEFYVHRLDLATDLSVRYATTSPSYNATFYDVSFLPNGTAILTQSFVGSGSTPLTVLNFSSGVFSPGSEEYPQDGTLTATQDKSRIALLPSNRSDAPVHVYTAGKGVTATHDGYEDGVTGGNLGVQAISSNGEFVAQGVDRNIVNVYDGDLNFLVRLNDIYRDLPDITGVSFSQSGDKLYILSDIARQVFVFDTDDWSVSAGYLLQNPISTSKNFGNSLLVSPDQKHLAIAGEVSVEVIDLSIAVSNGGTSGDDTIEGGGNLNYHFGFEGNDNITANGYRNYLYGGKGDDKYFINSEYSFIAEYEGEGVDTIISNVSNFALPLWVEILQLGSVAISGSGNGGDNTLIGNDSANSLEGDRGNDILNGAGGDDVLNGGTGADTLIGGKGDDIYYVDDPLDVVKELSGEGSDLVKSDISYILPENVEILELTIASRAKSGTGNALDNVIIGNGNSNTIFGKEGDDRLSGNDGADILDGGAGNDFLDGGADADLVLFDGRRSDYSIFAFGTGFSVVDKRPGNWIDLVVNVESFRFADVELTAAQLRSAVDIPPSQWRVFAGSDFVGAIGGQGTIVGNTDKQDITLLDVPGRILFDSSFNRGGDIIRLAGDASDWMMGRDGSNAVFVSATQTVVVPVGVAGTVIAFGAEAHTLQVDTTTQSLRIGGRPIASDFRPAPDRGVPAPDPDGDDAATARMFLEPRGDAIVSGNFTVIGTPEPEHLTVLAGRVTLNTSFSLGGDTIVLDALSSVFTGARSGSNAVLASAAIDLVAPAGAKGMELEFDDGDRTLRFDQTVGAIMIEHQALTINAQPLAAIA